MRCWFGRLLCRLFGHSWHYQSLLMSAYSGTPPARTCLRCQFRRCERLVRGQWQFDPESSIP